MVRQLGHLFLQPMVDAMRHELAEPGATNADKPILEVRARSSPRATGVLAASRAHRRQRQARDPARHSRGLTKARPRGDRSRVEHQGQAFEQG